MSDSDLKKIEDWYMQKHENASALASKVENLLRDIFLNENIHFHAIFSRVKKLDSCQEKYKRNSYSSLDSFTDLVGIRVITYVKLDVEIIRNRISQLFDVKEVIDKSQTLEKNEMGYQSIHVLCVFGKERLAFPEYRRFEGEVFEIQIRTILQHAWAEIEHDRRYKFSGILPTGVDRSFSILAGALELADNEFNRIAKQIGDAKDFSIGKNSVHTKKYNIDIPVGTTKERLQTIGSLLKSHPGNDVVVIRIQSKNSRIKNIEMTLPYTVQYSKELWQRVGDIIASNYDDIPF